MTLTAERGTISSPSWSDRNASVTAGVGILLMAALSAFGIVAAVKGLVTPGDATRTAQDISGSETLFRFGIASLFVVVTLDVIDTFVATLSGSSSNLSSFTFIGEFLLALWLVAPGRRLSGSARCSASTASLNARR